MTSQTNGYLARQKSYQDLINSFCAEYPTHFQEVLKFNAYAKVWNRKTIFYSRNPSIIRDLAQTQLKEGIEQLNSFLIRFENARLRAFSHLEHYLKELPLLRNAERHPDYQRWLENLQRNHEKIHEICEIWMFNYLRGIGEGKKLIAIYKRANHLLQELKKPPESNLCPNIVNHFELKSL